MKNFIKHFVRIEAGRWTCVRAGEFEGTNGRFQVAIGTTLSIGTNYMGMDVAELLEEQFHKKNGFTHSQGSESSPESADDSIRLIPSRE